MQLIADVIIGIDPGAMGGIAVWTPNKDVEVFKMPKEAEGVVEIIEQYDGIKMAALEKVNSFHGDTDTPGKRFGIDKLLENASMLKTTLKILRVPYVPVHPKTWQADLGLTKRGILKTDRKAAYKLLAGKYYPGIKPTLWNADALLLTIFLRKKKKFDPLWIYKRIPAETAKQVFHP